MPFRNNYMRKVTLVDSKGNYFSWSLSSHLTSIQKASLKFPWPKYHRNLLLERAFSTATEKQTKHWASLLNTAILSKMLTSLRVVSQSLAVRNSPTGTESVFKARNGNQQALYHELKFLHVARNATAPTLLHFTQKTNLEEAGLPNLSEGHLLPLSCLLVDSMATTSRKKNVLQKKRMLMVATRV